MTDHLGDDVELYALGDVTAEERLRIEAHLATCAACTHRVGEAERTLAGLAELLPAYEMKPPKRAPAQPPWRQAIAAAFVAGLLLAGGSLTILDQRNANSDPDLRAQVAMTHAHFIHIPLSPAVAGAPSAKVIYPHDRAWLYAIVDDPAHTYRLVTVSGGQTRELGTLTAHGPSASLFVENPGIVGEVELRDGERVVARGTLQ